MPIGDRMHDIRAMHHVARGPQPGLAGAAVLVDPQAATLPVERLGQRLAALQTADPSLGRAAAAGLATIEIIETQNLLQRAQELGHHALKRLQDMQKDHSLIGYVRGVGLVLGIDLVKDRRSKERAVAEADQLMYACLGRGLSFKTSQGSFIPLSPPLTITQPELDQALDILESALTDVEKNQ